LTSIARPLGQQQIGEFESRSTHSAHFYGRFGASYFVTICCQRRGDL